MNISDRIQNLRKIKGISQEELADKVGVSRQAVSKWESEQSNPDLDKIIIMSDYFEVTTDYILKGVEPLKQTGEDKKPLELTKKHFSKKVTICCGITLLMMGVAIGYNLHKLISTDDNLVISSQLSEVNNLVADFRFNAVPKYTNLDKTIRSYQFTVVPKVYTEGMTATFMIVTDDEQSITKEATLGNGTDFSAQIEIPYIYTDFNVNVIFSDSYGKYTQGLMENVKLYEEGGCSYSPIWNDEGV